MSDPVMMRDGGLLGPWVIWHNERPYPGIVQSACGSYVQRDKAKGYSESLIPFAVKTIAFSDTWPDNPLPTPWDWSQDDFAKELQRLYHSPFFSLPELRACYPGASIPQVSQPVAYSPLPFAQYQSQRDILWKLLRQSENEMALAKAEKEFGVRWWTEGDCWVTAFETIKKADLISAG